jgi:lysophospholipase L1-like esterase
VPVSWLWLIAALLLLLGDTGSVPAGNVALIGDSLAVGLTPHLRAELAPRSLDARPRGGTTALDWTSGKDAPKLAAALDAHPSLVLISLGTNDTHGTVTEEKLTERFRLLVERIEAAGAVPVFLEPPPLPWPYQSIARAARAAGARVISGPNVKMQPDKIHPTPAGSKAWAEHIRREL